MTTAQNTKYWKRWNAVVKHNNWRWLKGRLADGAVKNAGPYHEAIWNLATQLANKACRAPIADDLRHACHVLATGRDVSHGNLTNAQFDRLLLLWGNERDVDGLLINADDITAHTAWDNPDQARKASVIRAIEEAADEAYIRSITTDIWGTIYWRDLDVRRLLGLLRKVKGNAPARPGDPF